MFEKEDEVYLKKEFWFAKKQTVGTILSQLDDSHYEVGFEGIGAYSVPQDGLGYWLRFDKKAVEEWNDVSHEEFLNSVFHHDGVFKTFKEYKKFLLTLANNFPDGVPDSYFNDRINSMALNNALEKLRSKGIEIIEDEDGNISLGGMNDFNCGC